MIYFNGYGDGIREDDASLTEEPKVVDAGGDILPFCHLDGRRLEILTYRIKCEDARKRGDRVALMQGSSERGRDVIVRDSSGKLSTIVQCKNLDERLTEPALRKELLKLALHACLEPVILGDGPITYEVWSPSGFSDPAVTLVDTWPQQWTEELLRPAFDKLSTEYAKFKTLQWEDVADSVTSSFPSAVTKLKRNEGIDISIRVRKSTEIYAVFFEGKMVMDPEQVAKAVEAATANALKAFSDQDGMHLLDRVNSFLTNERIVGPSGYVMGLSQELVSQFNQAEYADYAKCAIQATFDLTSVVRTACARIADQVRLNLRQKFAPRTQETFSIVRAVLLHSLLARLNELPMATLAKHQPFLEQYNGMTLPERLESEVQRSWDDKQKCVQGYDPASHAPGSDEEFRHRIARALLNGFSSQEDFEAALRADVHDFFGDIEAAFRGFMELIPHQLLIITDTVTIFEKPALFRRMAESTNTMIKHRGSEIIPK